jgi:hypothetical protein
MLKTVTSLAFASACVMALATTPAGAQMAAGSTSGYSGPQTYRGDMPSTSAGTAGTEVITNGPQGSPPSNWSARQNVIESQRYDRLLETNRAFRQARMRSECGPINDPQLHANCLASFNQDEPIAGSSTSPRSYKSGSGS